MSEVGKGKIPWNVGISPSAETRVLIGKNAIGHTRWLGKTHTEESKLKMSKSHKGVVNPNVGLSNKRFNKPIHCLTNAKKYNSIADAANSLKVKASNISAVCRGKRKHARGLVFEYLDKESHDREENN